MKVNLPNTIQDIYFVGDVHGSWNIITYYIRQYEIQNSVFIFCGDVGIGFERLQHYTNYVIPELHKVLKKYNDLFIWFAGNHDDPKYFENQLINTNYVKCIPTYSIINVLGKNILNISGGISIDRVYRKNQDSIRLVNYMKYHNCDYQTAEQKCPLSYWENEPVIYQPKVEEHIDIICSHSAPSFCYPNDKGGIVAKFAEFDSELIKDIDEERFILDKVYEDYKDEVTHWYYGHFHKNNMQTINNTCFKLLNIGEICRHYACTNDNNIL